MASEGDGDVDDNGGVDQLVTPWNMSISSGYILLRDPHQNKGLAFTERERDAHYLHGLLPPTISTQEHQVKKVLHNLRQYQIPLHLFKRQRARS